MRKHVFDLISEETVEPDILCLAGPTLALGPQSFTYRQTLLDFQRFETIAADASGICEDISWVIAGCKALSRSEVGSKGA